MQNGITKLKIIFETSNTLTRHRDIKKLRMDSTWMYIPLVALIESVQMRPYNQKENLLSEAMRYITECEYF